MKNEVSKKPYSYLNREIFIKTDRTKGDARDMLWFLCKILRFDEMSNLFTVKFNDGIKEYIDLSQELFIKRKHIDKKVKLQKKLRVIGDEVIEHKRTVR